METGIFLSLGSNQGDRSANLAAACQEIGRFAKIIKHSAVYQTAPWGNEDQGDFYNQVLEIETSCTPHELLDNILSVEASLGRKRTIKWGPRIIDIDILFYGDQKISDPDLTLPHPNLHSRKLVLVPLAEIAPGLIHPVFTKKIETLLSECSDELPVTRVA